MTDFKNASTGMFEGARTRFPRLLPILKPDYVADCIVEAVESDKARLILPRLVMIVHPLRLLPVSWFDALMSLFGVARSLDGFVGRKK